MKKTVKDVIDFLSNGNDKNEQTVDTLKFGDENEIITGIALAFMPTYAVIERAAQLQANLLIVHEGIFYQHQDPQVNEQLPIYKEKMALIEQTGISIYRLHDYIHQAPIDGIMEGLIKELKWEDYLESHQRVYSIFSLPHISLKKIIDELKSKLHIQTMRYIGHLDKEYKRIAIMVGYRGGGEITIPAMIEENIDVVIYGEGPEWETPEFIRDANQLGYEKAAIILGHLDSEEAGMKFLSDSIKKEFPDIPVHFIPSKNVIDYY